MLALRISAALTSLLAIGFGAPLPWVAGHLLRDGRLPTFMGLFPMYGGPFFSRCSHGTFVVLLGAFMMVCAAELFAGYLLWSGHRMGAHLTLALLPAGAVFWIGFALPIPWVGAVARVAALAIGWSALR